MKPTDPEEQRGYEGHSPASGEIQVTAFYERPGAIGWRRASAAGAIVAISAIVLAINLGSSSPRPRSHQHTPLVTAAPISPINVKSELVEARTGGRDHDVDDP
jgi:hypothetical protein